MGQVFCLILTRVSSLATIPAVLYVDRVGRKPVLAVGAIGSKFLGDSSSLFDSLVIHLIKHANSFSQWL